MASRSKFQLLFWLPISILIGAMAGATSAAFLKSLEIATLLREVEPGLLWLLPLAGVLIVFVYKKYGLGSELGFALLTDEIHTQKKLLPLRMAPFVFIATTMTHLFGGSAGREGTAVQMSSALADQVHFYHPLGFSLSNDRRKIVLMMGIAAGFSAIFGTPLAGWIFSLEVFRMGKLRSHALVPCLFAAFSAHWICLFFISLFSAAPHTAYSIGIVPDYQWMGLLSAVIAGLCFGLCARSFSYLVHHTKSLLKSTIKIIYWRPFIGGVLVLLATEILDTRRYLGLGIPVIVESFHQVVPPADFIFKILFTVVTLGSGFVGGEVTPLFFIGATLGNALSHWLTLPFALLSGMGFTAVFAGAARTPIACTVMAYEVFGGQGLIYMTIACFASALVSGQKGIYHFHLKESHEIRN